jgi:Tfp pilus assembly protein PilN
MTTRRINLLPPERAERRRARQISGSIVAAGLVLIGVLALIFVAEIFRLNGQKNTLKTQQETNAALQSQVATLSQFQQLETQLQQKTTLLKNVTQDEVRWSVVLADVSLVIPTDTWLTNLTASEAVSSGTQAAPGTAASQVLGTIQLTGVTFSHLDVAKWLTRLAGVDAFTNTYLSISSKAVIGATGVVNFNSSVELSDQAFRRNQRGAERTP